MEKKMDSPPATSDSIQQPNPQWAIEQYKAKLADLGNIGTRHTTMTTYYVSILSALFAILALKDRSLANVESSVVLLVGAPGLLVSGLWFLSASYFRHVFRVKLKMLEKIEEALPFQTFEPEFNELKKVGALGWIRIERFVPIVFVGMFATLLLARFSVS